MPKTDFDDLATVYDEIISNELSFFDKEVGYFAEYKARLIKHLVQRTPESILDFGCGIGRNLTSLKSTFPLSSISGCDVSGESLKIAAAYDFARLYHLGNDSIEEKFDLIFVSCVFHHIRSGERSVVTERINRMLKPSGDIIVFEHNPYNPLTRKIVRNNPIDADALLIPMKNLEELFLGSGFRRLSHGYTVFFPGFLKTLRPLEVYMAWLPLGGQYYCHFTRD